MAGSCPKATDLTMWGCSWEARRSPVHASHTFAEKSADPVAARRAGLLRAAPHTAPLWPSKVPIQSPVSPWRSIGLPSLEAETRNSPSGVTSLKDTWRRERRQEGGWIVVDIV